MAGFFSQGVSFVQSSVWGSTLLLAIFCAAVPFFTGADVSLLLACFLSLLAAFAAPVWLLSVALALLALGGNRPSSEHAYWTLLLSAHILVGLELYLFRQRSKLRVVSSHNPLLLSGLVYVVLSVLSLSSLPWPFVIEELTLGSAASLLRVTEHSPLYSILSVINTVIAFGLGFAVFRLCSLNGKSRVQCSIAILVGLLLSIIAGLLDYYGLVLLAGFRDLDPIVNPGNVQYRLQSFFAHSGWYAEYITLTVPFTLVLLGLKRPFWQRVLCILIVMLIGEFALILAYQRGGWLSYPITLLGLWTAIYVTHRLESGKTGILIALRSSALKILISLPLTVVLSLLLVSTFKRDFNNEGVMSGYLSRFKAIGNTSDRTEFFLAGMQLGLKHPILGGGSESFAFEFEREFEDPGKPAFGRFNLPLHGSAHNVYAQTFAGKGLFGLLALLTCCYYLISSLRYVQDTYKLEFERKSILLIGACFAFAFLIYGNVQEVFYIQVLQILFFVVLGLTASALPESAQVQKGSLLCLGIPLVFLTHLVWEFGMPGSSIERWQKPLVKECYPQEKHPEHGQFRWCGPRSFVRWKAVSKGVVDIHLVPAAQASANPVKLTVVIDGTETGEFEVKQEKTTVSLPQVKLHKGSVLQFEVKEYFVPAMKMSGSKDTRKLSFQLLDVCARHRLAPECLSQQK